MISRITVNSWYLTHIFEINESSIIGDWYFPGYQLVSSVFASFFALTAAAVSLIYALSHKKKMFLTELKRFTKGNKPTDYQSMNSYLEQEEKSSEDDNQDHDMYHAIGATTDDQS